MAFPSRMCDMCIYVCRTCSSGPANVAYVCECVHHLIHVVRSLRHFKLRSWVRVRFRLFALVAGKTNPQLERAVVVPHWKVVHLERLTAGVTGVGDTGAGKFWVISDLWMGIYFKPWGERNLQQVIRWMYSFLAVHAEIATVTFHSHPVTLNT